MTTAREVASRMVRVADEDDDRACARYGAANPRFDGRGGWRPAITVRVRDGAVLSQHAGDFAGYGGTVGCFRARLFEEGDGWRISCYGADDCGLERAGLSEVRARRLWSLLRDHITRRTLARLGFVAA